MNISKNVIISYKSRLEKSINLSRVYIGDNSWGLANRLMLAHNHFRLLGPDTRFGNKCDCVDSIIIPRVRIGNNVIVQAGAIATNNIESNCIVSGNPATIKKKDIK